MDGSETSPLLIALVYSLVITNVILFVLWAVLFSRTRSPQSRPSRLSRMLGRQGVERVLSTFRPELSLIVPCYNVRGYVDDFLHSVFSQTAFPYRFEIIIVNDGSTDDLESAVDPWRKKHPGIIRYLSQENAGAAAARNTGIRLARGRWVSFPDPDDFLDKDYFKNMFPAARASRKTLAVFSELVYFFEHTAEFSETHPLAYRFETRQKTRELPDIGDWIMASVAHTWVRRSRIKRAKTEFDSRVFPGSEDGHFLNRLLNAHPGWSVRAVPGARYYYRKRQSQDSTLDRAKERKQWFLDELIFGHLDLVTAIAAAGQDIPRYIQRWSAYVLGWRVRRATDHPERIAHLSEAEKKTFDDTVSSLLNTIDLSAWDAFGLTGLTDDHTLGLLWRYRGLRVPEPTIHAEHIDQVNHLAQFSYRRGDGDDGFPEVFVDGEVVDVSSLSRVPHEFFGETLWENVFFWVPITPGGSIRFVLDGVPCSIRRDQKLLGKQASYPELLDVLTPGGLKALTRQKIQSLSALYRNCVVLIDSGYRADDNAEHLYRYLLTRGQADNVYYVLDRESSHWDRLEEEGFRLLPWKSDDHIAAHLNARVVASSHADDDIVWPVEKSWVASLARFQFVYLQHGVTLTDESSSLNRKPIRLLITATESEANSIRALDTKYRFSEQDVALTGFPRHDGLVSLAKSVTPDSILIVPTSTSGKGSALGQNTTGYDISPEEPSGADRLGQWQALLESVTLRELASAHQATIVFAPPPAMAHFMEEMVFPSWVHTVDTRHFSYQKLLASARVGITDYSSVVCDIALLDRPIVYFHTAQPRDNPYPPTTEPPYFDYESDGFGPVCHSIEETVTAIKRALEAKEDPRYKQRRLETFPLTDGSSSQRVMRAIGNIAGPLV